MCNVGVGIDTAASFFLISYHVPLFVTNRWITLLIAYFKLAGHCVLHSELVGPTILWESRAHTRQGFSWEKMHLLQRHPETSQRWGTTPMHAGLKQLPFHQKILFFFFNIMSTLTKFTWKGHYFFIGSTFFLLFLYGGKQHNMDARQINQSYSYSQHLCVPTRTSYIFPTGLF